MTGLAYKRWNMDSRGIFHAVSRAAQFTVSSQLAR